MENSWQKTFNKYKAYFIKQYDYYKEQQSFRNFVELILTLIAIVVFSVFALKPTAVTIIDLNKEIKAKEKTLKEMNSKIASLQKAQNFLTQEQETVNLIDRTIPSFSDPEKVVGQIQAASTEAGPQVVSLSTSNIYLTKNTKNIISKESLPPNTNSFTINVSLLGNYENLIQAIKNYEQLARLIKIDELNISSQKEEKETLNLNLKIEALYYTEKQTTRTDQQKSTTGQENEKP